MSATNKNKHLVPFLAIAFGFLATPIRATAPTLDLDSCHDELDGVRTEAGGAADAAEEARTKRQDFEDCKQDEQRCISQRLDYASSIEDLESKMDDLDSRIQSTQTECGYEFSVNKLSSIEAAQKHLDASKRRFCQSVRRLLRLGLAPADALRMCRANANEDTCKSCMGVK